MTNLRERVVEAGAQAYEQESHGMADDETWQAFKKQYPDDYADMLREMGAALDAMLDCLTENQLEWFELAGWTDNAEDLIAVLRNPDALVTEEGT